MKIELTKAELTDILRDAGLLNDKQHIEYVRRSQYKINFDGIVLMVGQKE